MNQNDNASDSRKPYERPMLVVISLRPEEAVLGHCKVSGGSGPAGAGCAVVLGGCTPLGS